MMINIQQNAVAVESEIDWEDFERDDELLRLTTAERDEEIARRKQLEYLEDFERDDELLRLTTAERDEEIARRKQLDGTWVI